MAGVRKVRPRSGQEIENVAVELLNRFQPEVLKYACSFDVEAFFEFELQNDTGIEAIYKTLPMGLPGYTNSRTMRCYVSNILAEDEEQTITTRRLRSTLAHELGHCYLHVPDARKNKDFQQVFKDDGTHSIEQYRPENIKVYENSEWQAWRFASALLMPEICFRTVVERNWTKKQLQRAFDVNPAFIEVRIRELKIIKSVRRG
jgi:hypothetical protein